MADTSLLKALEALEKAERENFASKFRPYPSQLEFLNATENTICLLGGNRVGKSHVGSFAVMCHATGIYPEWWRGIRFAGPIDIWIAGVTSQRVRDTIQEKLFGKLGKMGTGMIPKSKILESSIIKKTGTPMALDRVDIKHINGGQSTIQFFSYEMEREKFMGSSVSLVWLDEEPPEEIYNECKMRVLDTSGNIMFTFTPLDGITPLYDNLMQDKAIHKVWLSMDDAKHLKPEDIERQLDGMSDSEKMARRHGKATVGAGKVFQFPEEDYTIEPFEIPPFWRRIGGLDVGMDHPTGALMAVIDDDADCIYVINEYRITGKTAVEHSSHLKHWGIKFLTDPSAFSRYQGLKMSTSSIYIDEGLDLMKANAGPGSVETSITEIRRRMGSGRLFIFTTCPMLLRELRTYRTKPSETGKPVIVKVDDDLVDPLRYICMGIQHAEIPKRLQKRVKIKHFRPADVRVGY